MKAANSALFVLALVAMVGCRSTVPDHRAGDPVPIIVLPDPRIKTAPKRFVLLKLPFGLIIHNGDYPDGAPLYCFFDRDDKRIVKTQDVTVLLAELRKLPDGATIDLVSKCTVPFYSEYGLDIDVQHKQIMALLDQKRFHRVSSSEEDDRHASFCYCEGGFVILDHCNPEQRAEGAAE